MSYACLVDPKSLNIFRKNEENSDQTDIIEENGKKIDKDSTEQKFFSKKGDTLLKIKLILLFNYFYQDNLNYNPIQYQPDYLDDPQLTEMTAGKNRTCLKFASYAVKYNNFIFNFFFKNLKSYSFKIQLN